MKNDPTSKPTRKIMCVVSFMVLALILPACVETFDGLFANPCEEQLTVEVFYGSPEEWRSEADPEPIIEADLAPLVVTRVPDAFDDPAQTSFTVAVQGTETVVAVDSTNRRESMGGDMAVVIPASACQS
jgi:hypothetical protein